MFRRILPKMFIAVMLVVCGVLWLLSECGTGLDFTFNAFWPSIIIVIGAAFLIGAFCYRSPGYLYFFVLFVSLGGIFLYAYYTPEKLASLSTLWPLVIGCPGLSSLIMFLVRKFNMTHLKFALFFILLSTALYLANAQIVSWGIMVPAIIVVAGLLLLSNMVFRKGESWDMEAYTGEETGEYTQEEENEKSDSDD